MTAVVRHAATVVLTMLCVCAGCGTGPDAAFLAVGGEYRFAADIVRSYDCSPQIAQIPDADRCSTSTDVIVVGVDTVEADIGLDTYVPARVCEFDGCRDDPFRGRFTGLATVRVVRCGGATGSPCKEEPVAAYDVAISHATVFCGGEWLPAVCDGREGGSVVSVGVEIPGVIQAPFGVALGEEIRGRIADIFLSDRDIVQGEWVLRPRSPRPPGVPGGV